MSWGEDGKRERERRKHGERRARKKDKKNDQLKASNIVEHTIQLSITINISGLNF